MFPSLTHIFYLLLLAETFIHIVKSIIFTFLFYIYFENFHILSQMGSKFENNVNIYTIIVISSFFFLCES